MRSSVALSFGVLLALLPSTVAATDWLFAADAALVRHDNLPRARLAQDRISDTSLEVSVSADRELPWRAPGIFTLKLRGGLDGYHHTDDLNQARFGLGLEYWQRLGLGPQAPWWSVDTTLGYSSYAASMRDGGTWQAGIAMGRSWQNGFDLHGRLGYARRNGRGGVTGLNPDRVFNLEHWRADLSLDYATQGRWGLFGGLGLLHGTINTSTTMAGMIMGVWTDDPTFGPGWRTYRVNARVVIASLGVHYSIGPATRFDFGWERLDGRANATGASYDSDTYTLRLRHGF
jgi:hypothetical protein